MVLSLGKEACVGTSSEEAEGLEIVPFPVIAVEMEREKQSKKRGIKRDF